MRMSQITKRKQEILRLSIAGMNATDTACLLSMTKQSITNHRRALRQMFGVATYAEVVEQFKQMLEFHVERIAVSKVRYTPHFGEVLSRRETHVFESMARGNRAKEIAQELDISYRTVEAHMTNIRKKLGSRENWNAAMMQYHGPARLMVEGDL